MEKSKILNAIARGKTKTALEILLKTIPSSHKKFKELILLNGQYQANESVQRAGIITMDDYMIRVNKLNHNLLGFVDSLESEISMNDGEGNQKKLKLLFLGSQPPNTLKLNIENEYLEIRNAVKRKPIQFDIVEEMDVTLESFFEELKLEKPSILQYSGHGTPNGIILSSDNVSEDWQEIPWKYLIPPFSMNDSLKCAFIHTINSDDFARKLSRHVPFVIGIQGIMIEEDAVKFPPAFFASLAIKEDYKLAFETASKVVSSRVQQYSLPMDIIMFDSEITSLEKIGRYRMFIDGEEYKSMSGE